MSPLVRPGEQLSIRPSDIEVSPFLDKSGEVQMTEETCIDTREDKDEDPIRSFSVTSIQQVLRPLPERMSCKNYLFSTDFRFEEPRRVGAIDFGNEKTWARLSLDHKPLSLYLNTTVQENVRNLFTFKIVKSSQMNIYVGLRSCGPSFKHLKTHISWKFSLSNLSTIYSNPMYPELNKIQGYSKATITEGDSVSLRISGERLELLLNGHSLGTAFKSKEFVEDVTLKPFVILVDKDDTVEVCNGFSASKPRGRLEQERKKRPDKKQGRLRDYSLDIPRRHRIS